MNCFHCKNRHGDIGQFSLQNFRIEKHYCIIQKKHKNALTTKENTFVSRVQSFFCPFEWIELWHKRYYSMGEGGMLCVFAHTPTFSCANRPYDR